MRILTVKYDAEVQEAGSENWLPLVLQFFMTLVAFLLTFSFSEPNHSNALAGGGGLVWQPDHNARGLGSIPSEVLN